MAGPFRDRKFFIAFPDIFMRQTAFGSLLANSDIDAKHPMLTPTYPTSQITRERTQDCSNEYFISEDLTSRLKRIRIGFNPSAQMAAGWLAFAYGAAASATGTPANEVQTLTVTAGDPYTLSFTFEGLTGTTGLIPIDATAAVVQEQLNALRSIKQGAQNSINAAVTGSAGGPYTITFQNKLAKANLPLLVSSEVTAVVAETTPGENKEHGLTRSTSDQPPQTTLIYGFEGDVTPARKIGNVVVNEIAFSGSRGQKVLCELDLVASWPISAGAYDVPACVNFSPVMAKDCRLSVNDVFYAEGLREFRYVYSNNIITDEDAFPFDDIDAIRFERDDRTSLFTFQVEGSKGDALYELAESEAYEDVDLHLGQPGDRLSIFAPYAKLRLPEADTTFIGSANRSAINVEAEPFYNVGQAGSPDYAEANIDQTTAFLTTPA